MNVVYSCPETVSNVYVNQGEKLSEREGGREREGRGMPGGVREGGRREEFAKMPSHGSLQQAVKVRPGRGEQEKKGGKTPWFFRLISTTATKIMFCIHGRTFKTILA